MVGLFENLFQIRSQNAEKIHTHQREDSVSSNDSLQLRIFSNGNFS